MSKYRPKTDRKNGHSKPTTLPPKFKPGFLTTLDARTNIAKALRANRDEIVSDIGGLAEIGHIKLSLVERFVWLETVLQMMEDEMASGSIDRLGTWIQAVNSLSGLAKVLGVDRKGADRPWLAPVEPQTNANAESQSLGEASA
jgi:hypothetical protein